MKLRWISTLVVASFSISAMAQQPGQARKRADAPKPMAEANEDLIRNSSVGDSGPPLKFNTGEAPIKSQVGDTIKFSGWGSTPSGSTEKSTETPQPIIQAEADDDSFKSYIGYPRHEVGLINSFDNISATWANSGQEFTFRSSTLAYGLKYEFVANPMLKLGVMYNRYDVSLSAARVSGKRFNQSKETLDQYGVNTEYCSISSRNFYRQYCFGGLLMNDSYPVLKFTGSSDLVMGRADDIVVGLHVAAQFPLTDYVHVKPILGYNYGTGAGNSGSLSAIYNTKFYFRTEIPWLVSRQWTLRLHGDYSSRQATIEGFNGTNKDKWETDSTYIGGGLDAVYIF